MIQTITNRSPDTLNTILNPTTTTPKTIGRPKKIPAKILPKVVKVTTRLQKKAKAEEEITADMILRKSGVSACARTLQNTFKKNGIKFKKLKEGLALTEGDVIDRFEWATRSLIFSASTSVRPCTMHRMMHSIKLDIRACTRPARGPYEARTGPVRGPYGARWKNTINMEINKKEKCII